MSYPNFQNDYRFIGPFLPFAGGLLIGGLLTPKAPNQTMYYQPIPYYVGQPVPYYPNYIKQYQTFNPYYNNFNGGQNITYNPQNPFYSTYVK